MTGAALAALFVGLALFAAGYVTGAAVMRRLGARQRRQVITPDRRVSFDYPRQAAGAEGEL